MPKSCHSLLVPVAFPLQPSKSCDLGIRWNNRLEPLSNDPGIGPPRALATS